MKGSQLTAEESALLKAWRECEATIRKEERNQALVDVSSIMGWLTCKDYSREYLFKMVVELFDKASQGTDEKATIRTAVLFYRPLANPLPEEVK